MKQFAVLFFNFALLAAAQCSPGAGTPTSPIVIACNAPASQAQSLIRILDRVLSAGLNADAVLARLDGMTGSTAKPAGERRVLSAADVEKLVRSLAAFKGQKVSIGYAGVDAEAAQLADQMDELARRAGWVQTGPVVSGGGSARGDSAGIDLTVAERTRATDALWNGLLAAGLDVIAHINPAAVRDGSISIFVYSRR